MEVEQDSVVARKMVDVDRVGSEKDILIMGS